MMYDLRNLSDITNYPDKVSWNMATTWIIADMLPLCQRAQQKLSLLLRNGGRVEFVVFLYLSPRAVINCSPLAYRPF